MNDSTIEFSLPLSEADVRGIRIGDYLLLNGRIFTARDAVHKYLAAGHAAPCNLKHAVIYHCGPIIVEHDNKEIVIAAGPTTSVREEIYMADIIKRFKLRGIIGKGGMGKKTLQACEQVGCVYLHAIGGAAQVLAEAVEKVVNVYLKDEFGSPEALRELQIRRFPVIATMDAHGNSLHADITAKSRHNLKKLLRKQDIK